jgi:prolyl-tRNA synthetase
MCEQLYVKLQKAGLTVLYHDTDDRAGTKFSDMDLIGLPFRVAIGPKGAEQGMVEIKNRTNGDIIELSPSDAVNFLTHQIFSE